MIKASHAVTPQVHGMANKFWSDYIKGIGRDQRTIGTKTGRGLPSRLNRRADHRKSTPRTGSGRHAPRLARGRVFRGRRYLPGAKGRDKRPGLDRLLKAVARRDVDMVAAWSVDRLGRSLIDLLDFLRDLHAKGVDLFLHQQGLDTSTPSGRAMFQMLGVFAEFERSMIRERVMAGLSRAKADGIQLGRRRLEDSDADKVAAIVAARAKGTGIRRIARDLGVGVGTVLRLTGDAA
jgi:hypothetical protein